MGTVKETLETLQKDISDAARAAGREPADICLVAVSKGQEAARMAEALSAGQRVFGENRVQEAQEHWAKIKPLYADHSPPDPAGAGSSPPLAGGQGGEIKLHLIGPLQTNKTRDAVALFDVIETLDRPKLAKALAEEMTRQNRALPCFIQVNTGQEEQKAGVAPSGLADLLEACRTEGLQVDGLMCIPPVNEPAGLHFAFLKTLADHFGLKNLSMGMSADYPKAIAAGATHIRVGTALFGSRS